MKLRIVVIGSASAAMACTPSAPPTPVPSPLGPLTPAKPTAVGMRRDLTRVLDSLMQSGIAGGAAPGAVLALGRYGHIVYLKGFGRQDTASTSPPVDENTMYDMASLTKVIATTTAAMILEEQGQLDLDRTVVSYLPEFNAPDKAPITVRMIVTH